MKKVQSRTHVPTRTETDVVLVKTPSRGSSWCFPPFWPQMDAALQPLRCSDADPGAPWTQPRPGILLWNQATVVIQQSQTLCSLITTRPDTFIDILDAEGSLYKPAAAAGSAVSMVAAAFLLITKVFFSRCWKICHVSMKTPKGDPGCLHTDLKIRAKTKRKLSTHADILEMRTNAAHALVPSALL